MNSISTGYLAGIHSFDDPMVLFSATISEAGALASSFCVFPFVYVSTPKYVFETFGGLFMAVTGFSIALNLVIVFIYNLYRVLKRRKEEEPEEEAKESSSSEEEEKKEEKPLEDDIEAVSLSSLEEEEDEEPLAVPAKEPEPEIEIFAQEISTKKRKGERVKKQGEDDLGGVDTGTSFYAGPSYQSYAPSPAFEEEKKEGKKKFKPHKKLEGLFS